MKCWLSVGQVPSLGSPYLGRARNRSYARFVYMTQSEYPPQHSRSALCMRGILPCEGKLALIATLAFSTAVCVFSLTCPLPAQTTIDTGSIVGTVCDPSGAVISGARVTIANVATGRVIDLTTNFAGAFNSGALIPGNYMARFSAKGFSPVAVP